VTGPTRCNKQAVPSFPKCRFSGNPRRQSWRVPQQVCPRSHQRKDFGARLAAIMCKAITSTRRRRGWSVLHIGVLSIAFHLLGCANGVEQASPSSTGTPLIAPTILTQPAAQSVPMGVAATYVVAATGSSLSYQWSKNGSAISGTTAASYTTPATAFADTGSSYTVIVGNSVGAVTSAAATRLRRAICASSR
jgi:hypothetical protein